jgi:arylsulfatase A-like enzyme
VVDRDHLVSGVDLVPTLCDYAGVKVPKDCRGISVRGAIEKRSVSAREFVVSELATDKERPEVMGRMIRSARYKYVAYSIGRNNEQLFDLSEDPGENYNLAQQPEESSELERHRGLLRDWVRYTDDHFPVPK